jgi:hypothetical protein
MKTSRSMPWIMAGGLLIALTFIPATPASAQDVLYVVNNKVGSAIWLFDPRQRPNHLHPVRHAGAHANCSRWLCWHW